LAKRIRWNDEQNEETLGEFKSKKLETRVATVQVLSPSDSLKMQEVMEPDNAK